MQRKVIASAVAIGLSASLITAPAADAAQIGVKDQLDTCAVRLTDAEQSALDRAKANLSVPQAGKALSDAFEAVYPEFKAPAGTFLTHPTVKAYVDAYVAGKEPSQAVEAEVIDLYDNELARFQDERADAYDAYIEARGLATYPKLADTDLFRELEDEIPVLNQVDASRESVDVDPIGLVIDYLELPADKARVFRNSLENSEFGRTTLAQYQDYAKAYTAAQRACADGGKTEVRFPTTRATPGEGQTTGSPNKNTGTGTGTTGTGTKDDKANTTGNKDDVGSSETGKVVGIIAGVLAAIGLIAAGVVAFAPQLGIQLPF